MTVTSQIDLLRRLAQASPTLEGGIELSVDHIDDQHGVVRLQQGDVVAELKATGLSVPYPSGLRRLLSQDPDVDLVVVERAPPGLRSAAENEGVSYLDVKGRGRVVADGLVYVATPHLDRGRFGVPRSSPFAQRSCRVVRVLLTDPRRSWRLSDVAVLSHLNPGNVHRAFSALVDRGMVERDNDAYVIADPGSLLEAWADQNQPPRERAWMRADGDLRAFVRDLIRLFEGDAVVSGELAAEELAPYLPAESAIVHCLDPERFSRLQHTDKPRSLPRLGLSPGEVLVDVADEGYGDFRSDETGLPLASPTQIYVDMAQDRGRGREAAEHLRRQVIGF
jgi:hypothetical protein